MSKEKLQSGSVFFFSPVFSSTILVFVWFFFLKMISLFQGRLLVCLLSSTWNWFRKKCNTHMASDTFVCQYLTSKKP